MTEPDTSPSSAEASQDGLTATIAVSVSPSIRTQVQAVASQDDRSESQWVRRLIMAELERLERRLA